MADTKSFKQEFREELVPEYQKLLKENTVSLAILDHEFQIIAFALKKYLEILAGPQPGDRIDIKQQVLKDTFTVVSDFYPMISGEVFDITKSWYDQLAASPDYLAPNFVQDYYAQLDSGEPIDYWSLMDKYGLS